MCAYCAYLLLPRLSGLVYVHEIEVTVPTDGSAGRGLPALRLAALGLCMSALLVSDRDACQAGIRGEGISRAKQQSTHKSTAGKRQARDKLHSRSWMAVVISLSLSPQLMQLLC